MSASKGVGALLKGTLAVFWTHVQTPLLPPACLLPGIETVFSVTED